LEPSRPEVPPPPPVKESETPFSQEILRETNVERDSSTLTSGVVSLFSNKNFWIAMLVVLLVLSFLGVNFVMLLGQIFQPIVNVFWILVSNILSLFGYTTGTVLNKTVDVVSGTAKAGIDIAEGTVQSVGNLLIQGSSTDVDATTRAQLASNILGAPAAAAAIASSPTANVIQPPATQQTTTTTIQQVAPSTLDVVLNRAASPSARSKEPSPDMSTSAIQSSTTWCLVGEMDGKRTCADVSSSNLCLSGQYYPTKSDCVNGGGRPGKEGFANGGLMMATPPPLPPNAAHGVPTGVFLTPPSTTTTPALQQQLQQQQQPSYQVAPTGGVIVQFPSLGPPQYMGPPNFPPPGMTQVQPQLQLQQQPNIAIGAPQLGVGAPNYIDFSQKQPLL